MANWVEKAKQKRRNRNRLVTLFLIYIILTVFTILYWVVFLILIRRSNQRGDK